MTKEGHCWGGVGLGWGLPGLRRRRPYSLAELGQPFCSLTLRCQPLEWTSRCQWGRCVDVWSPGQPGARRLCCCFCCLVAKLCLTLCDPMDCSTPTLPVLHCLPELAQTHVHRVSDAIQPSHPLSPLLFLTSIFPSIRVFSNESVLRVRWPKYWHFSFSISASKEYSVWASFRTDWFHLLAVHESSSAPQFKSTGYKALASPMASPEAPNVVIHLLLKYYQGPVRGPVGTTQSCRTSDREGGIAEALEEESSG